MRREDATKKTGYGSIWLRRDGDYVSVLVEFGGEQVEVIREPYDNNFDHCITSLGIEDTLIARGLL